jgi:hypothetical protein
MLFFFENKANENNKMIPPARLVGYPVFLYPVWVGHQSCW